MGGAQADVLSLGGYHCSGFPQLLLMCFLSSSSAVRLDWARVNGIIMFMFHSVLCICLTNQERGQNNPVFQYNLFIFKSYHATLVAVTLGAWLMLHCLNIPNKILLSVISTGLCENILRVTISASLHPGLLYQFCYQNIIHCDSDHLIPPKSKPLFPVVATMTC